MTAISQESAPAISKGGAMFLDMKIAFISWSNFTSNQAKIQDLSRSSSTRTLTAFGGAMFGATVRLIGSVAFTNNSAVLTTNLTTGAEAAGGALYVGEVASFRNGSLRFTSNYAQSTISAYGGALYAQLGTSTGGVVLRSVDFIGNFVSVSTRRATSAHGGAAYFDWTDLTKDARIVFKFATFTANLALISNGSSAAAMSALGGALYINGARWASVSRVRARQKSYAYLIPPYDHRTQMCPGSHITTVVCPCR
jgi:hypothetical protein